MKVVSIIGSLFILLTSACVAPPQPPLRTALETREMQTRQFAVKDTRLVMKALLNVLQDEGYIAKNSVVELGLITASKEIDNENQTDAIFSTLLMGNQARWRKIVMIEANANVSEFGNDTRVRISFQRRILDNLGNVIQTQEITEHKFYQDFFTKVDKGIFIQREGI